MLSRYDKYRKFKSGFMSALAVFCAIMVITPLGFILYYLIREGFGAINLDFFTQLPKPVGETGGGMANAIVGTGVLVALAMVIAIPIGLLGGIYLSEYGSERINFWIRFGADILNGVPSIVWGMTAYAIIVVPTKTFSAYAGGVALAFIAIPLILRTTEEVLVLVPNSYREAAMALGIPRWKIIFHIILRTASKGLVTGILLAMGRIAGETAPLLFTSFGNHFWSHSLKEPIAALPLQIFTYAISPYDDWHRQAWAAALVLIFLVFLLSIGVRFVSGGLKKA
jgi:phosphate transport system permease protein